MKEKKAHVIGVRLSNDLYEDFVKAIEQYNKKNKYAEATISSIVKENIIEWLKQNPVGVV